jgi:hypothetical protein
MTLSRALLIVHTACGRVAMIVAMGVVLARAAPAYADSVDDLIQQLKDDDSDKVRLSAALNLTKLGNPRAIPALTTAVVSDTNNTVRGAAAVGLGKLVNDKTSAKVKREAVEALTQAVGESRAGDLVHREAEKALKAIGATVPVQAAGGGSIYVNIGPMSSRTGDNSSDAKLKMLMAKVATKTMAKVASGMSTTWPGGVPTKAMLDAKATQGFYVDGTLNELKVKESGSSTTVSCKINMLLASYPDKSIFGLLNGGASVQASSSARDIALAREDCVSAVVEDLIAKKIVPTINTKAGSP